MRKIDILWLIEHKARELDVACATTALLSGITEIDCQIRHAHKGTAKVIREFDPLIVILPYCYQSDGTVIARFAKAWPNAVFFNLAWEQIHYEAHLKLKAPRDHFARRVVMHHGWGQFYREYLLASGVPDNRIFVNGNPVYQLYQEPYRNYFKKRAELARLYGLNSEARWVFIPENYKWAFVTDRQIEKNVRFGAAPSEIFELKDYCLRSLVEVLDWCNRAAKGTNTEIILRPRPSTPLRRIVELFESEIGISSSGPHFIKEESVRDWILASDVVMSSHSTSLIEAAIAGRPVYQLEPDPLPSGLVCDWYRHVPSLPSYEDFETVCDSGGTANFARLAAWATSEMLSNGDPIRNLAESLKTLKETAEASNIRPSGAVTYLNPWRTRWGWWAYRGARKIGAGPRILGSLLLGQLSTEGSGNKNRMSGASLIKSGRRYLQRYVKKRNAHVDKLTSLDVDQATTNWRAALGIT